MQTIQRFLLAEGVIFMAGALTHFGVLMSGYEHRKAGTAESVIGGVLLTALLITLARPGVARTAGIAAQVFALLGTALGLVMIAIGVGPRTTPDVLYHALLVTTLAAGLLTAFRAPRLTSHAVH